MADYTKHTDQELLVLLKHDDQSAFSELYDRYWDKIFALAANALDSPEEAEECVQDIFCGLWRRRESIVLRYSLYTYLAVAVKYRVINILDRNYRKRNLMSTYQPAEFFAPSAEIPMLEKEIFSRLENAVCQLPEKCQLVFRMSREEGKTHKQIAEELQISEKTVNNHLSKALKDLQGNLTDSSTAFITIFFFFH